MGILIRLNLVGNNKDELNVVVQNDGGQCHNFSKAGVVADFNISFDTRARNAADGCAGNENGNENEAGSNERANAADLLGYCSPCSYPNAAVIDLTDEELPDESYDDSTQPQVTMGYYVVEKILGSRLNSRTKQHEFLLTLKNCSSVENSWNPVSESQHFDLSDPDSVLYVQKTEDLFTCHREQNPYDVVNNKSWNSLGTEESSYHIDGENSFEEPRIVSIDLPETAPELYQEEMEHDSFPSSVASPSLCEEKKIFDEVSASQNDSESYKCQNCGLTFVEQFSWKKHSRKCQSHQFLCSSCPRRFSCEYFLKKHSKIHTNRIQHRCTMCGFTYGSFALLKDHEKQVHRLRYQRKYLHSSTSSRKRKRNKKPPFECSVCNRGFREKRILQEHIRSQHDGAPVFSCSRCDGFFFSHAQLKEHELSQRCEERRRSALAPGKSYENIFWELRDGDGHDNNGDDDDDVTNFTVPVSPSSVASRILGPNESDSCREHSCSQCDRTFDFKADALTHANTAHSVDKAFPVDCILCGLAVKYRHSLKLHMFRHTGEKPLKCKYCDYKCVQTISLQTHSRKHHGIIMQTKKREESKTNVRPV